MPTTVVAFSGAYDFSCKEQLRAEFARLNFEPGLVLDLSNVSYVDSCFIAELLALHQRRERNGFRTESIVTAPPVLRLFDILDLTGTFRIVPTLGDAIGENGDTSSLKRAFAGIEDAKSTSPSKTDAE